MKERCGEHEPGGIGGSGRVGRHFPAMSVAMEDGEQADDRHGSGDRRLDAEGDDCAEHDHRQGDTDLDERNRDVGDSEDAAKGHHEDEG